MQKLEEINTKQIVTESVETKQVITESVADPVRQSAVPVFKSSIARGIVEQFGYELDEAEGTSPWANDPAKDAAWKALSPEDQKWLGGADPTDKFILARAPNKGKPAGGTAASPAPAAPTGTTAQGDDEGNTMITKPDGTTMVVGPDGNAIKPGSNPNLPQNKPSSAAMTAADQDDADMGAAMRANAAGGNSTSAATGVGNPGEEAAAQAGGSTAASPAKPAEVPAGINPETGEKYTSVADAPLQLPPGAEPEAGTTVAGGNTAKPAGGTAASPTKPAAGKTGFKADPIGQSIANQMKMTTPDAIKLFQKNNGLTADGMIGPATTKALQAAAQKMGLTVASGVGTSTAGAGRGGAGGPTAAQLASAPAPAGGTAASPAANPEAAKIDAEIKRFSSKNNMSLQANKDYVAGLEKKKAAATGGTTQTPAQQAVAKDIGNFAGESVNYAEDQVLLRIKSLAGL